jgi:putative tryptophan/tyrosine transport system substrate-binding protein
MNPDKKIQLIVGLIIMIFISIVDEREALSQRTPLVFILHSYERNHVCGQPQHDGVVAMLKKAGFIENQNLELQLYYMDTKRMNNTPELIIKQADIALKKIKRLKPDVLVTLDDNAFRWVALKLVDSDISIVFSGLNGQPEIYNRQTPFMLSRENPGHNITGVYEKLHIVDAVRVHSRLFPDFQKLKIITDQSPTGNAINTQIKLELEHADILIDWEMKVVKDWDEYQAEIISSNNDPKIGAIYPVALLLKDKQGNVYTAPEIFKWTIQVSKKPEIAVNYAFTKLGLFGGAAVDFYSMGQQAGQMVVKILKGKTPGLIPIEEASRYALAFNLKRARQLNIDIPNEILLAADEVVK